jgi:microcystin-dependent protein
MAIQFANNAATTLFSSVTVSDAQIVVSPGGGALFPTAGSGNYFMVTVVDQTTGTPEIMKVTSRTADTFTVTRAQEGTSAKAFPSGSPVELRLTAQSILDAITIALPRGIITMWAGAADNVPSGWHLCDGSDNTPDLRNMFIVGAGSSYSPGNTGGSQNMSPAVTVNPAATGIQIQGHALTINEIPSHTHTLKGAVHVFEYGSKNGVTMDMYDKDFTTSATGGNQAHTHSVTDNSHAHTAQVVSFDNRPPYYALAYIMKL